MSTSGRPDAELGKIVAEALRIPLSRVDPALNRSNCYEWDSLAHMELILNVESRFGFKFSLEEAGQLESLSDLEQLVNRRKPGSL